MRIYDHRYLIFTVASELRRLSQYGIYNGIPEQTGNVVQRCRGLHAPTGTLVCFTRDAGMHTSGWWKNPDYERCYHLSISFKDPLTMQPRPRDKKISGQWVEAFYGDNKRMLWIEPPFSDVGRSNDVWHYRLFMAPDWHTPLLPRKEVYSRDFIPQGWKSWSDVQADMAVPNQGEPVEKAGLSR